jgi:hypothetical protein
MTLFQPKRPLRPARKERKRIQGTTLLDTKIDLIVNIVRAFNLPLRKDTEVGALSKLYFMHRTFEAYENLVVVVCFLN